MHRRAQRVPSDAARRAPSQKLARRGRIARRRAQRVPSDAASHAMAEARAKGTRPRVGGLAARVSERRGDLNSRRVRRRRGRHVDILRGRARSRRKPVSSPRTTRAGASDRAAASDRPGRAALGVEPRGDARAGVGPERRLRGNPKVAPEIFAEDFRDRARRTWVDRKRRGFARRCVLEGAALLRSRAASAPGSGRRRTRSTPRPRRAGAPR